MECRTFYVHIQGNTQVPVPTQYLVVQNLKTKSHSTTYDVMERDMTSPNDETLQQDTIRDETWGTVGQNIPPSSIKLCGMA